MQPTFRHVPPKTPRSIERDPPAVHLRHDHRVARARAEDDQIEVVGAHPCKCAGCPDSFRCSPGPGRTTPTTLIAELIRRPNHACAVHAARPALRPRRAGAALLRRDRLAAPRQAPCGVRQGRQRHAGEAGRGPREAGLLQPRHAGEEPRVPPVRPRAALDLLDEHEPRRRRQARRRRWARRSTSTSARSTRSRRSSARPPPPSRASAGASCRGSRAVSGCSSSRSTTTRATSDPARSRCW